MGVDCKQEKMHLTLVSEETFNFDNFDNSHIIVSYDQNISLIFYVKDGSHVRL